MTLAMFWTPKLDPAVFEAVTANYNKALVEATALQIAQVVAEF